MIGNKVYTSIYIPINKTGKEIKHSVKRFHKTILYSIIIKIRIAFKKDMGK
jgi:hypothetical protein